MYNQEPGTLAGSLTCVTGSQVLEPLSFLPGCISNKRRQDLILGTSVRRVCVSSDGPVHYVTLSALWENDFLFKYPVRVSCEVVLGIFKFKIYYFCLKGRERVCVE